MTKQEKAYARAYLEVARHNLFRALETVAREDDEILSRSISRGIDKVESSLDLLGDKL